MSDRHEAGVLRKHGETVEMSIISGVSGVSFFAVFLWLLDQDVPSEAAFYSGMGVLVVVAIVLYILIAGRWSR